MNNGGIYACKICKAPLTFLKTWTPPNIKTHKRNKWDRLTCLTMRLLLCNRDKRMQWHYAQQMMDSWTGHGMLIQRQKTNMTDDFNCNSDLAYSEAEIEFEWFKGPLYTIQWFNIYSLTL